MSLVNQNAYRGPEPTVLHRVMRAEGVVPEWEEILAGKVISESVVGRCS